MLLAACTMVLGLAGCSTQGPSELQPHIRQARVELQARADGSVVVDQHLDVQVPIGPSVLTDVAIPVRRHSPSDNTKDVVQQISELQVTSGGVDVPFNQTLRAIGWGQAYLLRIGQLGNASLWPSQHYDIHYVIADAIDTTSSTPSLDWLVVAMGEIDQYHLSVTGPSTPSTSTCSNQVQCTSTIDGSAATTSAKDLPVTDWATLRTTWPAGAFPSARLNLQPRLEVEDDRAGTAFREGHDSKVTGRINADGSADITEVVSAQGLPSGRWERVLYTTFAHQVPWDWRHDRQFAVSNLTVRVLDAQGQSDKREPAPAQLQYRQDTEARTTGYTKVSMGHGISGQGTTATIEVRYHLSGGTLTQDGQSTFSLVPTVVDGFDGPFTSTWSAAGGIAGVGCRSIEDPGNQCIPMRHTTSGEQASVQAGSLPDNDALLQLTLTRRLPDANAPMVQSRSLTNMLGGVRNVAIGAAALAIALVAARLVRRRWPRRGQIRTWPLRLVADVPGALGLVAGGGLWLIASADAGLGWSGVAVAVSSALYWLGCAPSSTNTRGSTNARGSKHVRDDASLDDPSSPDSPGEASTPSSAVSPSSDD